MKKEIAPAPENKTQVLDEYNVEPLFYKVAEHINAARQALKRTVDTEMVKAYWLIGRDIVEEEQKGSSRADYGAHLLKSLSERLTQKYKKGFSISTLRDARQFYLIYSEYSPIHHAVRGESKKFSANLGWVHYRSLMRVNRIEARKFYEIEAEKNGWSGRELERQIGSLLYDRLAKSKDKEGLLKLSLLC
jgi:hypothetical protein